MLILKSLAMDVKTELLCLGDTVSVVLHTTDAVRSDGSGTSNAPVQQSEATSAVEDVAPAAAAAAAGPPPPPAAATLEAVLGMLQRLLLANEAASLPVQHQVGEDFSPGRTCAKGAS